MDHQPFDMNVLFAALFINFLIISIVPRLIKKPTGINIIDETILYINSQKGFLIPSSIVLSIVIYGVHVWMQHDGTSPEF
jgi:hypothetical protein